MGSGPFARRIAEIEEEEGDQRLDFWVKKEEEEGGQKFLSYFRAPLTFSRIGGKPNRGVTELWIH
jgi:hypothetical protein